MPNDAVRELIDEIRLYLSWYSRPRQARRAGDLPDQVPEGIARLQDRLRAVDNLAAAESEAAQGGVETTDSCSICGRPNTWHPDCPICAEIARLKRRIRELEAAQAPAAPDVEALAKAYWEAQRRHVGQLIDYDSGMHWDHVSPMLKEPYYAGIRAVLAALQPAEPDPDAAGIALLGGSEAVLARIDGGQPAETNGGGNG